MCPIQRTVCARLALSHHIKLNATGTYTELKYKKKKKNKRHNAHTAAHFKRSNQWYSSNLALDKFIGDQFFDYARIQSVPCNKNTQTAEEQQRRQPKRHDIKSIT